MSPVFHERLPEDKITASAFGREVLETIAFGCINYMLDHGIPVTKDGFDQLVELSRSTGLNGRIAFQMYPWTQERFQGLLGAKYSDKPLDETRLEKFRTRPSIRNRIMNLAVGESRTEKDDHLLQLLAEHFGENEGMILLKALIVGDCQRDLVAERIEEICKQGDVRNALQQFIETPSKIRLGLDATGEK